MSATRRARSPFAFAKGACQTLFATLLLTILPDIIPETPLIYQPTLEELRLLNQHFIIQKWNSCIQIILNLWAAQSWNTIVLIGLPTLAFTLGFIYIAGVYLIKFIKFIYGQFEWCFIFTELLESSLVSSIDYFTELKDYFEIINHSSLAVFNGIELISIVTVVFIIIKATIDFIIFIVLIDFEGLSIPLDALYGQNYEVTKKLAVEGLTIDLPSTIRNTPIVYEQVDSNFNFIATSTLSTFPLTSTPLKSNDTISTFNFNFIPPPTTPTNYNSYTSNAAAEAEQVESLCSELKSSTHATLLAVLARPTSTLITDQFNYQNTLASPSTGIQYPDLRCQPLIFTRPPPTPTTPTPSSRKSNFSKFTSNTSSTHESDPIPLTPPQDTLLFNFTTEASTSTGLNLDHYISSDEEDKGYVSGDSSFEKDWERDNYEEDDFKDDEEYDEEYDEEEEEEDEEEDDDEEEIERFLNPLPVHRFIPFVPSEPKITVQEESVKKVEDDFSYNYDEKLPGAWFGPIYLEEDKPIKPLPATVTRRRYHSKRASRVQVLEPSPPQASGCENKSKPLATATPSSSPSIIRNKRKFGSLSLRTAKKEFGDSKASFDNRCIRNRTKAPAYVPEVLKQAWNQLLISRHAKRFESINIGSIKFGTFEALVAAQERSKEGRKIASIPKKSLVF